MGFQPTIQNLHLISCCCCFSVKNEFMSDKNACSHSTLGHLRDAVGITMPNSLNILSETSAAIFFGFFNFFFLLD